MLRSAPASTSTSVLAKKEPVIDEEWRKSEKLAPTGEVFAVIQDLLSEKQDSEDPLAAEEHRGSLPIGLDSVQDRDR